MHAQTPTCAAPGCNSVASDNGEDTAVGTGALTHLTGGNPGQLSYDTAAGFRALYSNTSGGSYNSAFGALALYSNTTLNEVQQQAAEIRDLKKLVIEMQTGLLKLQVKEELVSQR